MRWLYYGQVAHDDETTWRSMWWTMWSSTRWTFPMMWMMKVHIGCSHVDMRRQVGPLNNEEDPWKVLDGPKSHEEGIYHVDSIWRHLEVYK